MALQALLGDRTVEIERDGDVVRLDGREVEARVTRLSEHTIHLLLDGRSYILTTERQPDGSVRVTHGGQSHTVRIKSERDQLLERMGMADAASAAAADLRAPMPGLVLQVLVEPGQAVEAGQGLVVLEAMKMENELRAEAAATVASVPAAPGSAVAKGDVLVTFEVAA